VDTVSEAKRSRFTRERTEGVIALGVLALLLAFCYARVCLTLAGQWWTNTMYSYGFLIPFISGYLVWVQRARLAALRLAPSALAGSALLVGGLAMLLVAHAGGVIVLEETSLIVVLTGMVLLILGPVWLRGLLLPLGYLSLMIPAWDVFTDHLHAPFQLYSASVGVSLLNALGVPVVRDGFFVKLPSITLKVAEVCSGVNYLIAVIAIGIPLAYLSFRDWPRRILLICIAMIIALLSNAFRVALIGMLVYLGMAGDIHGPFHILQGMSVAFVGFAALFVTASLLGRGRRAPPTPDPAGAGERNNARPPSLPLMPILCTCTLLLTTGSLLHFWTARPVPLARGFETIPAAAGAWSGEDVPPDSALEAALRPDRVFSRVYRKSDGAAVRVYVGYHSYQTQGKELVNDGTGRLHRRASLHTVTEVPTRVDGLGVRLVEPDAERQSLLLFWYDVGGRTADGRFQVQVLTASSALLRRTTYGALIEMACDIPRGTDSASALRHTEELLRILYPELKLCLPRS